MSEIKTFEQLFDHYLYKRNREVMEDVTFDQLVKGFEKYGEPLNPANWSSSQLIRHAREEIVDLSHYVTALEDRIFYLESYAAMLENKASSYEIDIYTLIEKYLEVRNGPKEDTSKGLE